MTGSRCDVIARKVPRSPVHLVEDPCSTEVGFNVPCLPDVDTGSGHPGSDPGVLTNVEDAFYKLKTDNGLLQRPYSRSEVSNLLEELVPLESVVAEEKSLPSVASSTNYGCNNAEEQQAVIL
ncbi:hypothetical protein AAG570_012109 [Ranatra chinensis]|uniref:Uncharacterized protein n=1 Tax=Ranatra chinensis TaxID=642074 RepID=A0ABD0Z459_9HEMI